MTTILAQQRTPETLTQARQFLDALAVDDYFYVRAIDDKGGQSTNNCGTADSVIPWLAEWNDKGCGAFVTVNAGGTKGTDITRARAFFVDYDEPGTAGELLKNCPLDPTIMVETSPGKYHAYWVVDGIEDLKEYDKALAKFSKVMGGDPAVKDRARVMRIPGYYHLKGAPYLSKLCFSDGPHHTWMAFRDWLNTVEERPVSNLYHGRDLPPPAAGVPPYVEKALESAVATIATAGEGSRNATLNEQAYKIFGFSKEGYIDQSVVRAHLEAAANTCGLMGAEIRATLDSAWGAAEPRQIPAKKGRPEKSNVTATVTFLSTDDAGLQRPDPSPAMVETREPIYFPEITGRQAYPVDLLGKLLGGAAQAIADAVQAPIETAAHAILTVAAFAAQNRANVEIDVRKIPLSLFVLTVSESGERKSSADRLAALPLENYQRALMDIYPDRLKEYRDALAIFKKEYAAALNGDNPARSLAHLQEPEPPPAPLILAQEPTLEGLHKSFMRGLPSQALFTDEGGQFFGGHAMNPDNMIKTIAGLSKFWDGSPIIRTRAGDGESAAMYDRRLSIHLMVQPAVVTKYLSDPILMHQGWLARFLLVRSTPRAGTREYRPAMGIPPPVASFHARITELLNKELVDEGGGCKLSTLQLDPGAQAMYADVYNMIEAAQAVGAEFEQIRPVASKAGEMALRLAGIFATIEASNSINTDQMTRGCYLVYYYLRAILRDNQLAEANEVDQLAVEYLEWIAALPGGEVAIDQIQRTAPRRTHRRRVDKIRSIMGYLVSAGKVICTATNTKGAPSQWKTN